MSLRSLEEFSWISKICNFLRQRFRRISHSASLFLLILFFVSTSNPLIGFICNLFSEIASWLKRTFHEKIVLNSIIFFIAVSLRSSFAWLLKNDFPQNEALRRHFIQDKQLKLNDEFKVLHKQASGHYLLPRVKTQLSL